MVVGFGIMLVLAITPIVHFVGIPLDPFIAGYFGISSVGGYTPSRAKRSLAFGGLLGSLIFLLTAVVAAALTALFGLYPIMIWVWVGVIVFTFYTISMGALGAMYAQLRSDD